VNERTALHEAGHAVVAEEVGFRPTTIELNDDGSGICYFDDPVTVPTLPRLRRELAVVLAGRVAEYIDTGSDLASLPAQSVVALECSPRTNRWATMADFHAHVVELHGSSDDPVAQVAAYRWQDRELPAAAEAAEEILRRKWDRVRSLAEQLIEAQDGVVRLSQAGGGTSARTESGSREAA
jgi:Fe-S-cluster formation regulator IscX/YfhJ